MVATASLAIRKATARVLKLSKDERARMLHEYEVKARRDELARLDDAIEKGEKTKSIEIARNMLGLGLPMETIIKATGLSHNEIKKLAH